MQTLKYVLLCDIYITLIFITDDNHSKIATHWKISLIILIFFEDSTKEILNNFNEKFNLLVDK